jgi:chaperonin cofactor prefoldin
MKTLFLFWLVCLSWLGAQAQNAPAAKPVNTPAAKPANPVVDTVAKPMMELDYYKKLAEQAQEQADRAHDDIKSYYDMNTTVIVTIFAILLGLQLFNVKDQLNKNEEFVRNNVNAINQSLTTVTAEFEQLNRTLLTRLSDETANRDKAITDKINSLKKESESIIEEIYNKQEENKLWILNKTDLFISRYYAETAASNKNYNGALNHWLNYGEAFNQLGVTDYNPAIVQISNYLQKLTEIDEETFIRIEKLTRTLNENDAALGWINNNLLKVHLYKFSGSPPVKEYINHPKVNNDLS